MTRPPAQLEFRQALAAIDRSGHQRSTSDSFTVLLARARSGDAGARTARSRASTKLWRSRTKSTIVASLALPASPARRHPAEARSRRIPRPPRKPSGPRSPIAKQQGARSFDLLAALSLAKLYQSTGRPAEAHAVLAPALEGFSPTPEMPEIAEAQALLAALAETEEVKAAVAQRQRRLRLQTAYGQAVMWSKGFAAEETKAAFARAAELAAKSRRLFGALRGVHGQWTIGDRARRIAVGTGVGRGVPATKRRRRGGSRKQASPAAASA